MQTLIFSLVCIPAVCTLAVSGPTDRLPVDSTEALDHLDSLSWDRKTPLDAAGGPSSVHAFDFALSPAGSGSVEEGAIADEPPAASTERRAAPPAKGQFNTGKFTLHPAWFEDIDTGININWLAESPPAPTEMDAAMPVGAEQVYTIPHPGVLLLTVIGVASIGWLHRRKIL